jgi:prepilin-type N-terminal cleavage/methylation domain-containing protein
MDIRLKGNKGVTFIEILISLVISSILIASIYRLSIGQQKTYSVQEQVVDMQQNARIGINRMMSEIRMAGFGNVGDVLGLVGGVNGFTQVVTSGVNSITIVGGFKQIRRDNGTPILISSASGNQITLNYAADDFDGAAAHRFISIGGVESNTVSSRNVRVLTLGSNLKLNHRPDLYTIPIFKIQAITYTTGVSDGKPVLQRNENTAGGAQPLADNIENIQFDYLDANGIKLELPIANPGIIRMIKVTVRARTDMVDPKFKGGEAGDQGLDQGTYRIRQIASNVYLRNMGQSP